MDPASRDKRVLVLACLGIVLALSGCTWVGRQTTEVARLRGGLERAANEGPDGMGQESFAPPLEAETLPQRCSRSETEEWAALGEASPEAGLRAAACYVVFAKEGKDQRMRLGDARRGRAIAEKVLRTESGNAFAHYVLAYLTGLVAENSSAQGLQLVPVIEREALEAANLDPGLDRGGPDRMLGELYLRAPSFPMSVGDFSKAVFHFKRAVDLAPDHLENRLGLVEALLAEGEAPEACGELERVFRHLGGGDDSKENRNKALELLRILCSKLE